MASVVSQATWELCRQGFPSIAHEAKTHWRRGETYTPSLHCGLTSHLVRIIELCNQEAMAISESRPQR